MTPTKFSKRSAFMAVDVQNIWARQNPATLFRLNSAIDSLRKRMPIIWVFMLDGPRRPRQWPALNWESRALVDTRHSSAPTLRPKNGDWVTLKDEADAFGNLQLGPFLKQQGIDHLIVGGFLSQQCVLQTMTGARYYEHLRVTFAADLSADGGDERRLTHAECKAHKIRWHQRLTLQP